MVERIIGRLMNGAVFLGTCFLVNEEYVFTARHVLKNNDINLNNVTCQFYIDQEDNNAVIVYEDQENDFIILKLERTVSTQFYRISQQIIESDDKLQSCAYSAQELSWINFRGHISNILYNNRCEVIIENQSYVSDWEGASGGPIIMEGYVTGFIVEQKQGGNFKPTLEIVSMYTVIRKLLLRDSEMLKRINFGYNHYLQERLNRLRDDCKSLFSIELEKKYNFSIYYHVFKESEQSNQRLSQMVIDYIHDYGVELILDEQYDACNVRNKRDIEKTIRGKVNEVINLIRNSDHVVYIIIWMLIEGVLGCPRIGSCIYDANDVPRDIFINNDVVSLIIGNGYLDESFMKEFSNCINQLDKYLEMIQNDRYSIIPDKLVLDSLDYKTQEKINAVIFGNDNLENIKYSITILVGFNNSNLYRFKTTSDYKINSLKKYIKEYENECMQIITNSELVKNVDINWIFIPFGDVKKFSDTVKKTCI